MGAHNLCFVSCHVLFLQETKDLPCQKTVIHPCVQRCPACPCFSRVGRMHELVVCDKERIRTQSALDGVCQPKKWLWFPTRWLVKAGRLTLTFTVKTVASFRAYQSILFGLPVFCRFLQYLACFVLFLSWVRSMENVSWEPCISPNSRSFSEYGWAWRRKSARTC